MNSRTWAVILFLIGLSIVVSTWRSLSRVFTVEESAQGRVISQWSTSGSPQKDLMDTRRFMFDVAQEARDNPDIQPVQANLNFSSTTSRDDVIFVSFLSGNPPDIVSFKHSLVPDAIAAGQIRPLDDLIERENRIRANLNLPDFVSTLAGGEESLVRFRANPGDRRIRAWVERGAQAQEAARLLNMHGKVIGFNPPGMAKTLTYNGRLFEEASALGGEFSVLVDENGKARPPRTWQELRHFAALITVWGKQAFGERNPERPYGVILQGMDESFFARAIDPLAASAGSMGFNFTGSRWIEGVEEPVGRYDYADPAMLGALKLLLLMKADGSIRPGTEQRHYEESRAQLAQGRAAMMIDGWHAAKIAAQKNPAIKDKVGSASIPVPYDNEAEAAALTQMLGFRVGRGVPPRDGGSQASITCITTGSEHPDSAWDWLYRADRSPEARVPGWIDMFEIPNTEATAHLFFESQEPRWVELRKKIQPFQYQAYQVVQSAQVWPAPPLHGAVTSLDPYRLSMLQAFSSVADGAGETQLGPILEEVREDLQRYTAAVNADLAEKVRQGTAAPAEFTYPDWDPTSAGQFYLRQLGGSDPTTDAAIAELQAQLPAELQDFIGPSRPPAWPQLVSVLILLLIAAGGYLVWQWLRGVGRRPDGMRDLMREGRRNWQAYVFVGPAVLALFVFVIYPAFYQVYLSFYSGTGQASLDYVGMAHYARAFQDEKFWGEVIPNTGLYMVIVATLEVLFGLLLATLLNLSLRGMAIYRTFFFVPMVVSMSVVAVIFFGLLAGSDNTVNYVLGSLGLENLQTDWLNDSDVALFTLMGVGIWHGLPYNTILCLAGLQSISKDLYEAARIDGAGVRARFLRITIPQLAPILLIILFNSLVGAARSFGNVYILTKGNNGTEIVSTYVFKTGFEFKEHSLPDIGYASTLSIIYAVLLAGLIIVNVIYISRRLRRQYGSQQVAATPVASGGAA